MEEKFIENVKPLQQFMEDGSFLMPEVPAVFRALQALGAPDYVDYDYLLSLSGIAVRLAWQQGWAGHVQIPNQGIFYNQGGKSTEELTLERAGASFTVRAIAETGLEKAKQEIRQSIDRSVPVILIGGEHVTAAILGYRADELFGVYIFSDQNKRIEPYAYNRIALEQVPEKYILISNYTPRPVDRKLLTETLKTAIYQARTSHMAAFGDTALGLSSFDALAEMLVWDESFEPLTPAAAYEGDIRFPYDRPDGYYRTDGARTLDARFWDCLLYTSRCV